MSKKRQTLTPSGQTVNSPVDAGRGTIKDNYLAALVTSKVYKMQVVKAKKGKGSFQRKSKYQAKATGPESYLIAA